MSCIQLLCTTGAASWMSVNIVVVYIGSGRMDPLCINKERLLCVWGVTSVFVSEFWNLYAERVENARSMNMQVRQLYFGSRHRSGERLLVVINYICSRPFLSILLAVFFFVKDCFFFSYNNFRETCFIHDIFLCNFHEVTMQLHGVLDKKKYIFFNVKYKCSVAICVGGTSLINSVLWFLKFMKLIGIYEKFTITNLAW